MNILPEMTRSVFGCYRFARADQNAFQFFNISIEGFYRSFAAMIIILPVIGIYSFFLAQMSEADVGMIEVVTSEMMITLLSWVLYLASLYILARYFGVAENYSVFVIVYNWSQVFFAIIWLPLSFLAVTQASQEAAAILSMIFIMASYFYLWYIIMRSLAVSTSTAIALAVLEFIITLGIRLSAGHI
jgi:hypothetical protein